MAPVDHMAYGWINPILAYTFSVLGSLLALMIAIRARERTGGRRIGLLVLAATVLGSTGIWLMHFIAMLGFDVPSLSLRYDLWLTMVSLVTAVVVVGFGLLVVGTGRLSVWRVLLGGPITGLGVAAMHYTGMAAMEFNGEIRYHVGRLTASVAIAVVAATVALCLAMWVRTPSVTVLAALAMGLAVSSMHYTGMSAVRVRPTGGVAEQHGVSPFTLLVPIAVLACVQVFGLFYAMAGMSVSAENTLDGGPVPLRAPGAAPPDVARQWRPDGGQAPALPHRPGPTHRHR